MLGGGLPLAAVAGPRTLLEQLAPVGETYQAGTLSGNPLATAAGLATLRLLDAGAYERLGRATRAPRGRPASRQPPPPASPVQVPRATGLLTVFFSGRPVSDYAGARDCRRGRLCDVLQRDARPGRLSAAVAVRGLVSVAGTRRTMHLDRTVEAAADAFEAVARA